MMQSEGTLDDAAVAASMQAAAHATLAAADADLIKRRGYLRIGAVCWLIALAFFIPGLVLCGRLDEAACIGLLSAGCVPTALAFAASLCACVANLRAHRSLKRALSHERGADDSLPE